GRRRCGTTEFAARSVRTGRGGAFRGRRERGRGGGRGVGRVSGVVGTAVVGDVRQSGAASRCRRAAPRAWSAAGARAHLRHAPVARRNAAGTAVGAAVRGSAGGRGDDGRGWRRGSVAAAAAMPAGDGGGRAVRL